MVQFRNDVVTVFESSLFRTTSSVIHTPDLLLLVDPNWLPHEVETIRQWVDFCNKDKKTVFLLFTHSDYDHILGYRAFPEAVVIASESFDKNNGKESVVEQIMKWDDEYYVRRNYLIEYPKVDIVISEDGQHLSQGATRLTFYLAPGHNEDGIFTVVESNWQTGLPGEKNQPAIWIAGDYLSNVEFPYIYYNSFAYERTLSKVDHILEKHDIGLLIPGHGDVALQQHEIKRRQEESCQYIRTLRKCQQEGIHFPLERLWERYPYRRGMESFHEENIQIIRNELRYWVNPPALKT